MLCDHEIKALCTHVDNSMITPFSPISSDVVGEHLIGPSWGLSSVGYDIRLGNMYKQMPVVDRSAFYRTVVDTRVDAPSVVQPPMESFKLDRLLLKPLHFVLSMSFERFNMPDDVAALCTGKSTLARMGILVFVTPAEPAWKGWLTLEIVNLGSIPVELVAGIGICQLNFFRTSSKPDKSYMKRSTRYQDQPNEPVEARIGRSVIIS